MPTSQNAPQHEIVVFVGYDAVNEKFIPIDGNGDLASVDRIGGRPPLDVRWVIKNRTGIAVKVRLRNFDRGDQGLCPVGGGDIIGCEFFSNTVNNQEEVVVTSALVREAGPKGYEYELFVERASNGVGNIIDPELQIDE